MKTLKSRLTCLWLCLACQQRISCCLMKYNSSVISSLWLALPTVGAKSPLGTVLIINLLGKGLTPRACMGDGGSIWWAPDIKKCHTRVEHRRPNICPHSILFDKQRNLRVMNTILSANQRWLFSDSSRGYWSPSRYKRIAASGNEIGWFLGFKSGTAVLTFTLCFLSSPLFSLFLPHFFLFLNI